MIVILLAMAMMQPKKDCLPVKTYDPTACMVDPTKPLKCGKYQHWVDGPIQDIKTGAILHGGRCFDDIHTLTEKEWQEMLQMKREWKDFNKRLDILHKKLEGK